MVQELWQPRPGGLDPRLFSQTDLDSNPGALAA